MKPGRGGGKNIHSTSLRASDLLGLGSKSELGLGSVRGCCKSECSPIYVLGPSLGPSSETCRVSLLLLHLRWQAGFPRGGARKCLPGAFARRVGERGCAPRAEAVDSVSQTWHRAAECGGSAHHSARYATGRRRMARLPAGSLAIRRLPKA